ncbi:MAG: hypothetical protein RMH84_06710, partial [Sulfolobales archaeon]|nr:hypothetical protein [Sulfolobales archaeon]
MLEVGEALPQHSSWEYVQVSSIFSYRSRCLGDRAVLVEVRWHGRGGQGAVTAAELVAHASILK